MSGLRRAARDWAWLYDARRGLSEAAIAARDGVSARRVRLGIRRARAAEPAPEDAGRPGRPADPSVIPLFPIRPLTPGSACPHREAIPPGSKLYCVVCHQTGVVQGDPSPADPGARAAGRPRPEPRRRRTPIDRSARPDPNPR